MITELSLKTDDFIGKCGLKEKNQLKTTDFLTEWLIWKGSYYENLLRSLGNPIGTQDCQIEFERVEIALKRAGILQN